MSSNHRRSRSKLIQLDRETYRKAKTGEMSLEALADYLMKHYPVYEIALALAETINYEAPKPITREEFEQHFRIRGVRADGSSESSELRGRPRTDVLP